MRLSVIKKFLSESDQSVCLKTLNALRTHSAITTFRLAGTCSHLTHALVVCSSSEVVGE
jgi:hypothetical protein